MQNLTNKGKTQIEKEFENYENEFKIAMKKFKSKTITDKNYDIPHIYLTEEEIKEANKELKKLDIKLRIIPLNEQFEQLNDENRKIKTLEEKFSKDNIPMSFYKEKNKLKKMKDGNDEDKKCKLNLKK